MNPRFFRDLTDREIAQIQRVTCMKLTAIVVLKIDHLGCVATRVNVLERAEVFNSKRSSIGLGYQNVKSRFKI